MTLDANGKRSGGNTDFAIQQLINSAVASTEVVDILEACDFDRPDIRVQSDEFMLDLQNMQHRNLAVEVLKKLLNSEILARIRTNVVQRPTAPRVRGTRVNTASRLSSSMSVP
ncbi:MAG: hypothetical protein DI533_06415 [Cereibacter sphaeroides]|uniref:Type I restriction enzyme HindI endonuclease subunit-like C-terminal domain-containing protein n=1 Tax=Cereibacter sphaeroides TaxID=1063 RepID=A0A2W5UR02_CERSP|nr:MAG: hypothetical protein DI533_06415 [Cereibacter sphaeroides]